MIRPYPFPGRLPKPPVKPYIRRRHKPEPKKERAVTLCIAAETWDTDNTPCYVLCADRQIESATSKAEIGLKIVAIGRGWHSMYAGDVDRAGELIFIIGKDLQECATLDRDHVPEVLRNSVRQLKERLANSLLNSRLAISYDRFLQTGKKELPPTVFREILQEVQELEIGCELIVAGFLDSRTRLFHIDRYGAVSHREHFVAIGVGATNAEAMLYFREQQIPTRLFQSVYNVFEAKRFGESSPSVGPATDMVVSWPDRHNFVPEIRQTLFEPLYHKYGPRKINLEDSDMELVKEIIHFGVKHF